MSLALDNCSINSTNRSRGIEERMVMPKVGKKKDGDGESKQKINTESDASESYLYVRMLYSGTLICNQIMANFVKNSMRNP